MLGWGENDRGQRSGTAPGGSIPYLVPMPAPDDDVVALGAGWYHTCARRQDDTVRCWGDNLAGQLGNPGMLDDTSASPVAVTGCP